ncbi:MAG: tetratricopeptide repeat protein, partial [Acidobacteriota bacterium]
PERRSPASLVDPLAVTPEMASYIEARVPRTLPRRIRLLKLRDAIFDPDHGIGIEYGSFGTYSAAETFAHRRGNCLSFTMLFVAFARHLGLSAEFVEVDEVTGWSQRGEFGLSHWHMLAEVEVDNATFEVDFLSWNERRYGSRRRIAGTRLRAHFLNNLGAEALANGDDGRALERLRAAHALDPSLAPAAINLAAAERRHGRPRRAEALLLGVLNDDRRNATAAANLALLYRDLGDAAEAERWQRRRQRFLDRNPFHHFRQGLRALLGDRLDEARRHLRRAVRTQRDEAIFHEYLAVTAQRLGNTERARDHLRDALELSTDELQRQRIEARLARLADG